MRLSHIVVPHSQYPAQKPDRTENLLLKHCGFEMPYNPQILFTVDIAQVACGLKVPERIKESKFH